MSDIDLLLVHPPFPGEKPGRTSRAIRDQFVDAMSAFALASDERDAADRWESQLDDLRDAVQRWTGNPLQIVDLSFAEWRHPGSHQQPLLTEARRDGVELRKARGLTWWRTPAADDA